jgi:ABC-type transport system involved in cytochrome bd biosynthesis fused ATPase/permease subunit
VAIQPLVASVAAVVVVVVAAALVVVVVGFVSTVAAVVVVVVVVVQLVAVAVVAVVVVVWVDWRVIAPDLPTRWHAARCDTAAQRYTTVARSAKFNQCHIRTGHIARQQATKQQQITYV